MRREIYARDGSTLDLPHLPMRPGWWEHERAFRQTIGNNGTQSQRLRRGFPCCARSVAIWQTSGNAGIAKPEATAQILCYARSATGYFASEQFYSKERTIVMKKWKNLRRRGSALVLALVICMGMFPNTVFADDNIGEEVGIAAESSESIVISADLSDTVSESKDQDKADRESSDVSVTVESARMVESTPQAAENNCDAASTEENKTSKENGTSEESQPPAPSDTPAESDGNVAQPEEDVTTEGNGISEESQPPAPSDTPAESDGNVAQPEEDVTTEGNGTPKESQTPASSDVPTENNEPSSDAQIHEESQDAELRRQSEEKEEPKKFDVKVEEIINQIVKIPEGYKETEAGSGVYEKIDQDVVVDTDGEEIDFDAEDNAQRVTTKTETKGQQTHKAIKDEAGNITGYEVVNSTVKTVTTVHEEKKTEILSNDVALPELKDEDENGNSVVFEDGKYIATEKIVDPNTNAEKVIVTTWEKVTGEDGTESWKKVTTTQTTTVETEKTDKKPVTYNVYQDEKGNIYFTVPVTENSTLGTGSIVPDFTGTNSGNSITDFNKYHTIWPSKPSAGEVGDEYFFVLAGSVIQSTILINAPGFNFNHMNPPTDGDRTGLLDAQICVLVDAQGNFHYVYCADANTPTAPGTHYELENLEDAKHFNADEETVAKLQAVATNGYWGVEGDGLGGFDSLLEKVQAAVNDGSIKTNLPGFCFTNPTWQDRIKGGAIAGTQAAIWAITNGENGINMDEVFNKWWQTISDENGIRDITAVPGSIPNTAHGAPVAFAQAVYEYLLLEADKAAQNPESQQPSTDLIGESDVKDVKVTVKELSEASDTETQAPSKYNTDISFILDVERDRINASKNDPLTVMILDPSNPDGAPLGVYRLVEEVDGSRQDGVSYAKYDPETNMYILENIVLPNGTNITLKLSGTQVVQKNAYLVTAEGGPDVSQSFIAVEEGEKSVDLSLNLHFSVSDPDPDPKPDPDPDPKPDPDPNPKPDPDPDPKPDPDPSPEPDPAPTPEPDQTPNPMPEPTPGSTPPSSHTPRGEEIPDEPSPLSTVPNTKILDEEIPLANLPQETVEIFDENVPLTSLPRTGDSSFPWHVMMVLSGISMLILTMKKKGEEA